MVIRSRRNTRTASRRRHQAQDHPKGDAWHRRDGHDLVDEPVQVHQEAANM
jgi:hypothetical protein